ncbi:adenosylhomocysteinase [Candidatus Peregrinibacteria bacterium CG11_big_fil_rev_8_21_14_0_20_46_8]|nr:MAG: adenosylhomocysteinase [Candidatus Peregrinibacteria bacterium CG11_big_fil_rev_8_21_14_0_20_46_8]
MHYAVKDIKLASQGAKKIEFAEAHMGALLEVRKRFAKQKPFKGLTIGMALHVTKETGVLVETLIAGGAKVVIASCNPLSTQDDVAAYLAKKGIPTYAYKGETKADYYKFIRAVIDHKPHITIDDGCDLVSEIHLKHAQLIPNILGGCEETTTGINRLIAMEADNALKYPMVAVNSNQTKHLFDNFYGTGQSTIDGILRATNILFAGKTVVVAGYGYCGRGVALRARGMGAKVIVTEIDAVRALQAAMDGYQVMPMLQAAKHGDIFVTATGGKHIIDIPHMKQMKNGAILSNCGHFNCEINAEGLAKLSTKKKEVRPHTVEYTLKSSRKIYLLSDGRLVNLAAAEGHPSEVMSLSFCGQALACEWIVKNAKTLEPKVYELPKNVDAEIATLQLRHMGIKIDTATKEQKKYAESWREGT